MYMYKYLQTTIMASPNLNDMPIEILKKIGKYLPPKTFVPLSFRIYNQHDEGNEYLISDNNNGIKMVKMTRETVINEPHDSDDEDSEPTITYKKFTYYMDNKDKVINTLKFMIRRFIDTPHGDYMGVCLKYGNFIKEDIMINVRHRESELDKVYEILTQYFDILGKIYTVKE